MSTHNHNGPNCSVCAQCDTVNYVVHLCPKHAAAPSLLEAAELVEAAIRGLKLTGPLKEDTDALWTAIAKAKGAEHA